jgi:hypothetical protein
VANIVLRKRSRKKNNLTWHFPHLFAACMGESKKTRAVEVGRPTINFIQRRGITMKRKITWLTSSLLLAVLACGWLFAPQARPVNAQGRARLHCNNGTLDGRYGYLFKGKIAGIGDVILSGVIIHSYDGTTSGHITASFNGQIIPFIPLNGTFKVNDDCTVTGESALPDGTKITTKAIIVDGGREYLLMNTDQGNLLSGSAKRID